jgi:hypothetical protein
VLIDQGVLSRRTLQNWPFPLKAYIAYCLALTRWHVKFSILSIEIVIAPKPTQIEQRKLSLKCSMLELSNALNIITLACTADLLEISIVFDLCDFRPEISSNPVINFWSHFPDLVIRSTREYYQLAKFEKIVFTVFDIN